MFKRIYIAAFVSFAWFAVLQSPAANAQVRGEILGPGATRMPVAIPELQLTSPDDDAAARTFIRVLRGDLELSGMFRVIDPTAYVPRSQDPEPTVANVNFDSWRSIGALGLLLGKYQVYGDTLTIDTRFFDVANRSMTGGRKLVGDVRDASQMAHRMADAVMLFVSGVAGPFESRIAFVSDRDSHFREIYLFDFDGTARAVTKHNSITMAPDWHPGEPVILFTSFKPKRPILYSMDLRTGFDSRIASKMGVNVGGAYSPDGTKILLAREEGGNTDIFELDPIAGKSVRLTNHWGIDVSPVWSPDGKRIAYCSSRSGSPQIYTQLAGGGPAKRLTFSGDYNCAPSWSPDGTHIAYAGRRQGKFQIFVIPALGGAARQLTFAGSNEDPTWSPDSRYIAFSGRRGSRNKIYMVDLFGRWEKQLTDGKGNDTSPAWSKRLN